MHRLYDVSRWMFLHFDSAYCKPISTFDYSGNIIRDSYRAVFPMNQQGIQNIKRIHLKSLELPIGFCNIRKGTNVLQFTLTYAQVVNDVIGSYTTVSYTVTLAEFYHTSIASLLIALNTACVSILPAGLIMTFSNVNSKIWITFTGTGWWVSSIVISETVLSKYILGLRAEQDLYDYSNKIYKALTCNININPDNYILMYFPSLNVMNASMSGQNCTFKIPCNAVTNQILFYREDDQFVTLADQRISDFTVLFYDRFGNLLNSSGLDYSFSLLLELEKV